MTSPRTNLGPLTTAFTYPASCSVVVQDCTTCTLAWQGQTCSTNEFNTQGVQDNLDCWPPRSGDNISSGIAVNGWGFYSPGLECPVGYATACSATGGVEGGFQFQFSVLSHETVVGCCPTGYSCVYHPGPGQAQTCYKYYTTGSFPTVQCSQGSSNKFSYVTVPTTVTATVPASISGTPAAKTAVVISTVVVLAPLIQINWQSTDRPTSTDQSTSTALPATDASATTPPTASASTSFAGPSGEGRLSRDATIGIAVSATVVGLLLIGIFAWWMRRRIRRPAVMPTLPPSYSGKTGPPTFVAEAPTERHAHEVEALPKGGSYAPRYEMPG